ncbi:MAG TPA: 23S rRNA (adenine(2030)-N(6))-methyltransferase RlmJ, partial [Dokdonella sp.]
MNYRHAFHAGNFADVFKHTILLELIDALEAKPGAFCYVDTHAGRGRYDLHSDEAMKTGEAAAGVQRLLAAPALPDALRRYVAQLRAFDAGSDEDLRQYPGSPLLAQARMRGQDRAILCELQAEEAAALKSALRGDTRLAIHQRDGYAALKALLPPPQKRGLVLIDPPFEAQAAEFDTIAVALADALRRWPNAIYAIWYPIKLRETLLPFYRWLHGHAGKADV